MWRLFRNTCFLAVLLLQTTPGLASGPKGPSTLLTNKITTQDICGISSDVLLCTRGGASRKKSSKKKTGKSSSSKTAAGGKRVGASAEAEKDSALADTLKKYKQILPLTRIYITMVGSATVLGLILGDELTQSLLAYNPMRVFKGLEIWRPFTAASFLGPPSIGWLMSGYYLFEYGSSLERAYGTPQHLVFLLTQLAILSSMCGLLGIPFFAQSMITAMLHVLSRAMPNQKVKWLVFTVPYWTLPYGLMATDVLQAGNAMAGLPHVLGILSGHFYHFHKFIWPKVGGEDWLIAPAFFSKTTAPKAAPAKVAKRKKGRKLGATK